MKNKKQCHLLIVKFSPKMHMKTKTILSSSRINLNMDGAPVPSRSHTPLTLFNPVLRRYCCTSTPALQHYDLQLFLQLQRRRTLQLRLLQLLRCLLHLHVAVDAGVELQTTCAATASAQARGDPIEIPLVSAAACFSFPILL